MEYLNDKIERFIRTSEGDFDALAMELFAYQFEKNAPYQAFCQAIEKTPQTVGRWQDIPAVPIRAFKSVNLTTFPTGRAAAVFHSSATTLGISSRHFLRTLTYYEMAVQWGFGRWMASQEEKVPMLILAPPPGEAPHSSLTWMFDTVKRRWGTPESGYYVQRGRLDEPRLIRQLDQLCKNGKPVILMGTTLAFLAFFDYLNGKPHSWVMPLGSRLMDTGGMKTQKHQVSRQEFLAAIEKTFGLGEPDCINEYGMCELSSQFYARGNDRWFQGPPWVRSVAIDLSTGQPASESETGLLQYVDLANVDSVLAVRTEDLGLTGPEGFALLGRAADAEIKGCSIAAERLLA